MLSLISWKAWTDFLTSAANVSAVVRRIDLQSIVQNCLCVPLPVWLLNVSYGFSMVFRHWLLLGTNLKSQEILSLTCVTVGFLNGAEFRAKHVFSRVIESVIESVMKRKLSMLWSQGKLFHISNTWYVMLFLCIFLCRNVFHFWETQQLKTGSAVRLSLLEDEAGFVCFNYSTKV